MGTGACATRLARDGRAWFALFVHSLVIEKKIRCELVDKISSPSHWWSIGTRVVWHLLRVSPGAPTNLACEGRVACLNGLVRGACQPHSSKRRFVPTPTPPHSSPARDRLPSAGLPSTSGCRQPRRHALEGSADGTRLEGRGSAARLALVAEASPSKSRAWLHPQLCR